MLDLFSWHFFFIYILPLCTVRPSQTLSPRSNVVLHLTRNRQTRVAGLDMIYQFDYWVIMNHMCLLRSFVSDVASINVRRITMHCNSFLFKHRRNNSLAVKRIHSTIEQLVHVVWMRFSDLLVGELVFDSIPNLSSFLIVLMCHLKPFFEAVPTSERLQRWAQPCKLFATKHAANPTINIP